MITPDELLGGIDRMAVLARSHYRCHYCNDELTRFKFHVDHKIPIERGGTHQPENLVASCEHCNTSKGHRNDAEFPTK